MRKLKDLMEKAKESGKLSDRLILHRGIINEGMFPTNPITEEEVLAQIIALEKNVSVGKSVARSITIASGILGSIIIALLIGILL